MNDNKRLRHEQKQRHEEERESRQERQSSAREFSTVEEMLRYDATQTIVPAGLAAKLNKSIAREPKPASPWWRRLWRPK